MPEELLDDQDVAGPELRVSLAEDESAADKVERLLRSYTTVELEDRPDFHRLDHHLTHNSPVVFGQR